jgi:hypothetical protein
MPLSSLFCPDDGGNIFIWNIVKYLWFMSTRPFCDNLCNNKFASATDEHQRQRGTQNCKASIWQMCKIWTGAYFLSRWLFTVWTDGELIWRGLRLIHHSWGRERWQIILRFHFKNRPERLMETKGNHSTAGIKTYLPKYCGLAAKGIYMMYSNGADKLRALVPRKNFHINMRPETFNLFYNCKNTV